MNADEREMRREARAETDLHDSARDANSGIEIPHNAVHLEGNILRSDRRATDFIETATHDLHTPLNVILGLCQVLERDSEPLSHKQQDAVDRIERNAHLLLKSVNDLLGHLRAGAYK